MLIDSMIIKLTKGGVGIGPDYSLTIHGNGKVIYAGIENVKVKGKVESSIDNNKVVSLLSQFKEAGFFSLNDVYSVEDSVGRPYTIISISIPKENGEMVTKSIKYHHGDRNVPKELKTLENKIDEMVDTNRWVGDLSDHEGFEPKKETKPSVSKPIPLETPKKRLTRLIAVGVTFVVVIVVLFFAIESGIIKLPFGERESSESLPGVTNLVTASSVNTFGDYVQSAYFEQGDTVYIYHEYANISTIGDTTCDISMDLTVSFYGEVYHSDSSHKTNMKNFSKWSFTTDESWPSGDYSATINLIDNILKKSSRSQTDFTIVEEFAEEPEITVLIPVAEKPEYRDYINKSIFYLNDTIYLYQEYTNITTINLTECDLYLDIIVTVNDVIVHSDFDLKSEVKNNAHYWYFITNVNWTTGTYSVTATLKDNINDKSTIKTIPSCFIYINIENPST